MKLNRWAWKIDIDITSVHGHADMVAAGSWHQASGQQGLGRQGHGQRQVIEWDWVLIGGRLWSGSCSVIIELCHGHG